MSAGIYARISLDRRDGEGVARQLADCRELAAQRGWDTTEYVDNDVSAFHGKRRPQYERLIEDLHAGRITAVVAYHPDRLYRRMTDLVDFIKAVQAAGAEVATVRAGDIDLATATGRMVAKIIGSIAEGEAERIGERVSRAKRERATQGRHSGGGARPFGLTLDRAELVDSEAAALRAAAAAILAGESWNSQVARLNAAGIRNTSGRAWAVGTLRRTLTSPHIAGLRTYRGEIVGPAAWPAIIDRGTWELLRADTATRRRGRPPSGRNLLTGLLECGRCRRALMVASTRNGKVYRCNMAQSTSGRGCGLSITGPPTEAHVTATVGGWLERPTFVAELDAYLAYGDPLLGDTQAELAEIERREVSAAQQWASGVMSDEAHAAALDVLRVRRAEIEARMAGAVRRSHPPVSAADMAAAWGAFTVPERREAIDLVAVTPVVVAPGRRPDGTVVPVGERLAGLRPVWEQ